MIFQNLFEFLFDLLIDSLMMCFFCTLLTPAAVRRCALRSPSTKPQKFEPFTIQKNDPARRVRTSRELATRPYFE
jgi:hypothetical protein